MDNKEKLGISQGLKLLAKSSVIVFIGLFLSKVLFYFYRFIIARSLGAEVYGLFSIAIIILLLVTSFFSAGINQGILRFIPLYSVKKEKVKYLFRFLLISLIISSIIGGFLLFLLSNIISEGIFHNPGLVIFLKIFIFLIPIYILSDFFLAIIRAYQEISWYSFIYNILQNVVKVILLLVLIYFGFKTNSVIYSYLIGVLIMLIVAYLFCRYKFKELFKSSKIKEKEKAVIKREFFSYTWPVMFFGLLNIILYWTDSFFIGYFKGALEVGFYNAAVPLAALMGFAPEIFMQLFFPLITREFSKENLVTIKEISKQVVKWIFIINLPFFILLILFPGAFINILFGKEYIIAENALRILAIGAFISSITASVSENLIFMTGKSKLLLLNLVFISIFSVVLNVFLIPLYGLNGAAISSTIVHLTLGIILLIQIKYYLGVIPLRRKMLKILIVSLVPTLMLLYVRKVVEINFLSLILLGSLFILFYLFLIFVTGCFDKNDFMIIGSIKNKLSKNKLN